MPPAFAMQEEIKATLEKIAKNSATCSSFVDWSCAEVDDECLLPSIMLGHWSAL
jgi:hypothetical protein